MNLPGFAQGSNRHRRQRDRPAGALRLGWGDLPVLPALAAHLQRAAFQVDVISLQPEELAAPQAGADRQEDRQGEPGAFRRVQQPAGAVGVEDGGILLLGARCPDGFAGIAREQFPLHGLPQGDGENAPMVPDGREVEASRLKFVDVLPGVRRAYPAGVILWRRIRRFSPVDREGAGGEQEDDAAVT